MRNNRISLQGLAHIGEFIGGIAIIVSLVYLAMQVSDSNRLLRSQAHYNALMLAQGPGAMMVQNPELSILVDRCQAGDDDLSPAVVITLQPIRSNGNQWLGVSVLPALRQLYTPSIMAGFRCLLPK